MELLLFTGVLIIIWSIISGIIHVLLNLLDLSDKIKIRIYRPIPKRYLVKDNPIYEIKQCSFSNSMYVYKWELGYEMSVDMQFLLILIPYPIDIFYYRYIQQVGFFACENNEIEDFASKYDLEDFYEIKHQEQERKYIEEIKKETRQKNLIENLNSTFTKNYE
jgi:hypothetical protein